MFKNHLVVLVFRNNTGGNMKLIFSFLIFLSLNSVYALEESSVFEAIRENIMAGKTCDEEPLESFWKVQSTKTRVYTSFWGKEDYQINYSKFGCGIGEKGSVVIAPGRTESSVEFYETALDLKASGFSPVYVVDHVSQGFSPRLLEDNHKGHIYRFSDYVNAFADAVKDIENDLKTVEGRGDSDPIHFLSNSMGGAIGIGYFQKMGDKNPFESAVLLGAMIRVNYLGFPQGNEDQPNGITNPTPLQTALYNELGVIAQARVYCKIYGCDAYTTAGAREAAEVHGSAFIEGRRDFVTAFERAPEQVMTHSKERYDLRTYVWESDEIKEFYNYAGLSNPQLGPPTLQWTKQAAKFNRDMRRDKKISKMNDMPILMLTGERDVRAYTPYQDGRRDLSEHIKFCDKVKLLKGNSTCTLLQVRGGFHELHKESDRFRVPVMREVVNHFTM